MSPSGSGSDLVAAGAGGAPGVVRFHWTVDDETLKDVNRASGMDSTASHLRGFLSHIFVAWADTPAERRPLFDAPVILSEDLVYIPSPCYVIAIAADRETMHCWYSVLVDAAPEELMEGRAGVKMFTATGPAEVISRFVDDTIRLFRFRSKTRHQGYTLYKRI